MVDANSPKRGHIMTFLSHADHLDALDFLASRESNAKTYARTFNRMMARASLSSVWDVSGRQYIDCIACAGSLPLGHHHPYVMERVDQFIKSGHILQALDIPTVAKLEFMRQLVAALPDGFAKSAKIQFCGPSGSDAVEAALKLFKTVTGRRSVIAFHGGYHGMTLGSLSLMGNLHAKSSIPGLTAETHFFPFPHARRCHFGLGGNASSVAASNYFENVLLDPESGITKPAMVIVEAVQGEGGCIPAPLDWLRRLREVTAAQDIPLVIDEVQTGFGRTGRMFAHEHAGIEPDAIVLSKALGGGFPLAVVVYHKRYDKWLPGAHAGTFRGNQIAMAAGAATIQYIREHDLALEAERKGKALLEALAPVAKLPCIGEIRGRGLMMGMEVVSPDGEPSHRHARWTVPPPSESRKLASNAVCSWRLAAGTGQCFAFYLP
jgi:diaminobutyrate-2-oxoglutarate transaminase